MQSEMTRLPLWAASGDSGAASLWGWWVELWEEVEGLRLLSRCELRDIVGLLHSFIHPFTHSLLYSFTFLVWALLSLFLVPGRSDFPVAE